jgi:isovaleryl-CoA dehydrogenase
MTAIVTSGRLCVAARVFGTRALRTSTGRRAASTYPIDDDLFQLNDEQKEVRACAYDLRIGSFFLQFRQSVFQLAQKELAPLAHDIDASNSFTQMRPFWRKLGDAGLLGITAPGNGHDM